LLIAPKISVKINKKLQQVRRFKSKAQKCKILHAILLRAELNHVFHQIVGNQICKCRVPERIVGGTAAVAHSIPFQVGIITAPSGKVPFCGGTLISPNFVLTAAHCTIEERASSLRIIVGEQDFTITGDGEQYHLVSEKLDHPNYKSDHSEANDFSILKLSTPVMLPSETAGLACLATDTTQTFVGETLTISGWGTIASGGPQSSALKVSTVIGISNTACQASYPAETIGTYQMCAAVKGTDTCQGDSGGKCVFSIIVVPQKLNFYNKFLQFLTLFELCKS
jgi:secreted trypsin-like serine protease